MPDNLNTEAKREAARTVIAEESRRVRILKKFTAARKVFESNPRGPSFLPVLNTVQFCLICYLDVPLLTWQMMCAETPWRRKLNARLLAMTLAEYLEDFPSLFGKNFRTSLGQSGAGDLLLGELARTMKKLHEFKRKHEPMLREIRNVTAAHRDNDADLFLGVVGGINPSEIWELSEEFSNLIGGLLKLFKSVLPLDFGVKG